MQEEKCMLTIELENKTDFNLRCTCARSGDEHVHMLTHPESTVIPPHSKGVALRAEAKKDAPQGCLGSCTFVVEAPGENERDEVTLNFVGAHQLEKRSFNVQSNKNMYPVSKPMVTEAGDNLCVSFVLGAHDTEKPLTTTHEPAQTAPAPSMPQPITEGHIPPAPPLPQNLRPIKPAPLPKETFGEELRRHRLVLSWALHRDRPRVQETVLIERPPPELVRMWQLEKEQEKEEKMRETQPLAPEQPEVKPEKEQKPGVVERLKGLFVSSKEKTQQVSTEAGSAMAAGGQRVGAALVEGAKLIAASLPTREQVSHVAGEAVEKTRQAMPSREQASTFTSGLREALESARETWGAGFQEGLHHQEKLKGPAQELKEAPAQVQLPPESGQLPAPAYPTVEKEKAVEELKPSAAGGIGTK